MSCKKSIVQINDFVKRSIGQNQLSKKIMFPKNKFSKDDSQKFVTQSVFELQKCLGTQNASPENFQHNLVNKFYHTRPLTSSFCDRDMNNSC